MALFKAQASEVDIIITTALIPGKPAPKLILADHVAVMRPGSVIVDLAAEAGGNCELTQPGRSIVTSNGVTVIGYTDLPSRLPGQASTLFANNVARLLTASFTAAPPASPAAAPGTSAPASASASTAPPVLTLNLTDDVVRMSTVTNAGRVLWPPEPIKVTAPPPKPAEAAAKAAPAAAAAAAAPAPKAASPAKHGSKKHGGGAPAPVLTAAEAKE